MEYTDRKNDALIPRGNSFAEVPLEEKIQTLKEIGSAAIPNILNAIAAAIKDFVSLSFIGRLNNPLLFASLGFGSTWTNAFGTALIYGLTAGFGVLASQAYGAQNYRKLGVFYQKSIVFSSCILLAIGFLLWFTRAELLFVGFEEQLATQIGFFIRCLLLDLFLCMICETNRFYLIAQNIFYTPALILITASFLHIFWCYIFVTVLNLELFGVAIARTITDGTAALSLYLYIKIKNPCSESWFPWTSECLDGLWKFGKDIVSQGSSIYMEWIAFEITTLVIGYLGDVTVLAAHAASLNYLFTNNTMSIGVVIAMSIFVGNAAGEGSVIKAKKYAYVGLLANFAITTVLLLILIVGRKGIAELYTEEPHVNSLTVTMLTFYIFGMHADLCCNSLAYALRALGQENFVLKGFIFSYYGIGLTCSLLTGIWLGFGYVGVWISLLSGAYVMLTLNLFRLYSLNWEKEIHKISNEMKHNKTPTTGQELELM